jgi:hypothetical protein
MQGGLFEDRSGGIMARRITFKPTGLTYILLVIVALIGTLGAVGFYMIHKYGRPAFSPDVTKRAEASIQARLGPDFEMHYVVLRGPAPDTTVCGYVGPKPAPSPGPHLPGPLPDQLFIYDGGKLTLQQDEPDDAKFARLVEARCAYIPKSQPLKY